MHFQLRHLIATPSRTDVFYPYLSKIKHWNPISKKSSNFLDVNGEEVPITFSRISTLSASGNHLIFGGLVGELIYRSIDSGSLYHLNVPANFHDAIINHIRFLGCSNSVSVSCNDCKVRLVDLESFQFTKDFPFQWAVNVSFYSYFSVLARVPKVNRFVFLVTHLIVTSLI